MTVYKRYKLMHGFISRKLLNMALFQFDYFPCDISLLIEDLKSIFGNSKFNVTVLRYSLAKVYVIFSFPHYFTWLGIPTYFTGYVFKNHKIATRGSLYHDIIEFSTVN
jgi:hypothetical protein